jgi:hypothetical protein
VLVLEIVFQLFYFDPFLMWLAHYNCFNSKSKNHISRKSFVLHKILSGVP